MKSEIAKKEITHKKKFLRVIKKGFKFIITLALVLIVSGVIYERVGLYQDSKKYKAPGKIVEVNKHNMHIFAEGKGDETVVFVSGWGTPSPYADFYPLYNEISKYARVAVCERPGYGYSEVTKNSRDVDTIAKEMHELLEKSGEKAPYILVGHSLGSLEVIRFAQMYKEEVKGIVMIDAGNPDYYATEELDKSDLGNVKFKWVMKNLGVIRLLTNHSKNCYNNFYEVRNQLSFVPANLKEVDTAMLLKNVVNRNEIDELERVKENAKIVVNGGKLGDIPLRILTAEDEGSKWIKSQEEFKVWSSNSKQRVVKGSSHFIHQYTPNEVNEEILQLLDKVK